MVPLTPVDVVGDATEDIGGRTETQKLFRRADGTEVVRAFGGPVHFLRGGRWEEVDTRVVPDGGRPGWLVSGANAWRAAFGPLRAGGVEITSGPGVFGFAPKDAPDVAPVVVGPNRVEYPGAFGAGTTLAYAVTSTGVTETITLEGPGATSFDFDLRTGGGLVPRPAASGLEVVDASGAVVARLAGGAARDTPVAVGGLRLRAARRMGVVTELSSDVSAVRVSLDAGDVGGLNYPVVVDPDVSMNTTANWTAASWCDLDAGMGQIFYSCVHPWWTSDGSDGEVAYGLDGVSTPPSSAEALLKFDFSNPALAGKSVDANLYVRVRGDASVVAPYTIHVGDATTDVAGPEGLFSGGGLGASTAVTVGPLNGGDVTDVFPVGASVERYVRGEAAGLGAWTPLYGFRLSDETDSYTYEISPPPVHMRSAYSTQAVAGWANWATPHVDLVLRTPPPQPQPAATTVADGASVATLRPTLGVDPVSPASVCDDPGNPDDGVKYLFRVATGADASSGSVIDSGWQAAPSWEVPEGLLTDEATYYWQAWVQDGCRDSQGRWYRTRALWRRSFTTSVRRLGAVGHNPYTSFSVGKGVSASVNLSNGNMVVDVPGPSTPSPAGPAGVSLSYNSQAGDDVGLDAQYFPGYVGNTGAPGFSRRDAQVNFDWGTGTPQASLTTSFGVRWLGNLAAPATASDYRFTLCSPLGIRNAGLSLDLDRNGTYEPGEQVLALPLEAECATSAPVALAGGTRYPVRVEYGHTSGAASIRLGWAGSGVPEAPVGQDPAAWVAPTYFVPGAGALPAGWSSSVDLDGGGAGYARLEDRSDRGAVLLTDSSGRRHLYSVVRDALGRVTQTAPPAGEYGVLSQNGDNTWTLSEADGTVMEFDSAGRPTQARHDGFTTSGARSWSYTYDTSVPAGVAARLRFVCPPTESTCGDATARKVTLSYNSDGLLEDVSHPDGTRTLVAYADGRLVKVTDYAGSDVEESVGFSYHPASAGFAAGKMGGLRPAASFEKDPATGVVGVDFRALVAYDTQSPPRVVRVVAPPLSGTCSDTPSGPACQIAGLTTTLAYDVGADGSGHTDVKGPRAAGWDPTGTYTTRSAFDSLGRPTDVTDASANVTHTEWDVRNQKTLERTPRESYQSADPLERQSDYAYDAEGNPTTVTGPRSAAPGGARPTTQSVYGLRGLRAAYFNNKDLSAASGGRAGVYTDPNVDFTSGEWAGAPRAGVNADNFSVRWSGYLWVAQGGDYTLQAAFDNGVRVYVDGVRWIEDWTNSPPQVLTSPAYPLAAGAHRVVVEMNDTGGPAQAVLSYRGPDTAGMTTVVPESVLTPGYGLVTETVDVNGSHAFSDYGERPELARAASGTRTAVSTVGAPTQTLVSTATYDAWGRPLTQTSPGGGLRYAATVLADAPAGYWRLGEPTGTLAADSSGAGRHGAYAGGVTRGRRGAVAGDPNPGVGLDGAGGRVGVAGGLLAGASSFSVEAWFNPASTAVGGGRHTVVSSGEHTGPGAFVLAQPEGAEDRLRIWVYVGSAWQWVDSTRTLEAGTWYYAAATWDGTGLRLYLDGVLEATGVFPGVWGPPTNGPTTIGGRSSDDQHWFPGRVDEVALYTSALSAERVAAHHRTGVAGDPAYTTTYTYWGAGETPGAGDAVCGASTSTSQAGALRSVSRPGEQTESWVYDAAGRPLGVTSRSGAVSRSSCAGYDARGRAVWSQPWDRSAAQRVASSYAAGDLVGMTDALSGRTLAWTYDRLGRAVSHTDALGLTTTYAYDGVDAQGVGAPGMLTAKTSVWNSNVATAYGYDRLGRVVRWVRAGQAADYAYDEGGRLSGRTFPSPVSGPRLVQGLNTDGSVASRSWSRAGDGAPLTSTGLSYRPDAKVAAETTAAGVRSFAYDSAGRLERASDSGDGTSRTYAFDTETNRTGLTRRTGSAVTGVVCQDTDATGRLVALRTGTTVCPGGAGDVLAYDDETPGVVGGGNLKSYQGRTYTYDARNLLVSVSLADGSTVNYERDPLGRLVRRTTSSWGFVTQDRRFGYEDGSDRVVVEGDYNTWFSWWLNWYVVYLGGPDGLVADTWGRHYLADPHGNVVGVTDAAGTLSGSWSYDEYGNVASGAAGQQWGWLGAQQRRVDATLGVTEMGARQYDPALGRFYSRDPVAGGSCGDYDYVCADPVNNTDLDGTRRRRRRGPRGGSDSRTSNALKRWCVPRAGACALAFRAMRRADAMTRGRFGAIRGRGTADAYRHLAWSAWMTITLGPSTARTVGTLHEEFAGNGARRMALHNNALGRQIGIATVYVGTPSDVSAYIDRQAMAYIAAGRTEQDEPGIFGKG